MEKLFCIHFIQGIISVYSCCVSLWLYFWNYYVDFHKGIISEQKNVNYLRILFVKWKFWDLIYSKYKEFFYEYHKGCFLCYISKYVNFPPCSYLKNKNFNNCIHMLLFVPFFVFKKKLTLCICPNDVSLSLLCCKFFVSLRVGFVNFQMN